MKTITINSNNEVLIRTIVDKVMVNVTPTDDEKTLIQTVYNLHKPQLSETDTYQLLSFDVRFKDDNEVISGVYNYRLNGVHDQKRF